MHHRRSVSRTDHGISRRPEWEQKDYWAWIGAEQCQTDQAKHFDAVEQIKKVLI